MRSLPRLCDENNLFVYGGSGGGVLTAWIVGHTDRFAAASVNFPVMNWLSFVGNTDGVSWYRNFDITRGTIPQSTCAAPR
jgi:dipeptidyl aminopeptidase/acylaminoacyl peptidase